MDKLANWQRPPEGYVTSAEAARRSGYSIDQIVTLAKTGRLPGCLVRRRWFIDGFTLDTFLANRRLRPKRGRPARFQW
jgi:hypothetical protein